MIKRLQNGRVNEWKKGMNEMNDKIILKMYE